MTQDDLATLAAGLVGTITGLALTGRVWPARATESHLQLAPYAGFHDGEITVTAPLPCAIRWCPDCGGFRDARLHPDGTFTCPDGHHQPHAGETTIQTPAPAPWPGAGAGTNHRVAGIDVSLTSTGIATLGGTIAIPTKGKRADSIIDRRRRLRHITDTVLTEIGHVDLAVIEGPVSYAQPGGSTWDRGGLWWLIVDGLIAREIPVAVMSPTARAKYATGNGASRKAAVMEAVQHRYGALCATDDEADALVLRAAGLDWLGTPLSAVPAGNRAALAGVQWPDLGTVA